MRDLKCCNCAACRRGRRSKHAKNEYRTAFKSMKRHNKIALRLGNYEELIYAKSIPYTD